MRFCFRPGDLEVQGDKPLWTCRGWRPRNAKGGCDDGYATDDIFFLEATVRIEPVRYLLYFLLGRASSIASHSTTLSPNVIQVCLFNQICKNGDELFELDVGEFFVCDVDEDGFDELEKILMVPPMQQTESSRTI